MKQLFELIDQLSIETDLQKRKKLHFEIDCLRNRINSQLLVDSIQKIYKETYE